MTRVGVKPLPRNVWSELFMDKFKRTRVIKTVLRSRTTSRRWTYLIGMILAFQGVSNVVDGELDSKKVSIFVY